MRVTDAGPQRGTDWIVVDQMLDTTRDPEACNDTGIGI
jgi:hypothetical protein